MDDNCSLNKKRRLKVSCLGQPVDSALEAPAASSCFPGSRTMLNFGAFNGLNRSYPQPFDPEEAANDYFDEYFNQPEKKHRLSIDQVNFLERKFLEDNRLEPERKMQLAKELNLQPRQITIWFQNRRARSRTKQLETDYDALHESYTKLKNEYDGILEENDRLKSEILGLKRDGPEGNMEKSSSFLQSEEKFPSDVSILEEDINGMISPEDEETIEFLELDQSDAWKKERDEFAEPFADFLESGDGSCGASDGSLFYGLQLEDQQEALNFWSY